jgi:methylmalonyl-CoA mutase C-terminal domain/subunit
MRKADRLRILIAKPGLDGHDRGAKALVYALRDSGMEVIYTGIRQTAEAIVQAALQEDVDVIGMSCLSGVHNRFFPRVIQLLRENGAEDIPVIGGGIIPEDDIPFLVESGVKAIFGPGSSIGSIVTAIREIAKNRGE